MVKPAAVKSVAQTVTNSTPNLGERIRSIRAALDLTQKDFAVRVGVAMRSIIRWEGGDSAPTGLAMKRLGELAVEAGIKW